jgi:hypothetical protein
MLRGAILAGQAVRGFGLLLALGCAAVFDGQMPASAAPTPEAYGLLTSSSYCWTTQILVPGARGGWMNDPETSRMQQGTRLLSQYEGGTVSAGGTVITRGDDKYRLIRVPCPPPPTGVTYHPFVGFEVGGGWSNTNFAVNPPFDVTGSGFVYGVNGGVLFNLPGTDVSFGPRIGWQGGNITGSTANPVASPFFMYAVRKAWLFYQEALISIPIHREIFGFEKTFLNGNSSQEVRFPFVTFSAGIAEADIKVTGTSGAFQVTDGGTRTGFTFTAGFGIPINQTFFPGAMDVYLQYRGSLFEPFDVNIPGRVRTDFWVQGLTFGTDFRF